MAVNKKDRIRAKRRTLRTRGKVRARSRMPRVCVFRSLKHVYAQIIDDAQHKTLASYSSFVLKDFSGDKKSIAYAVGLELAKRAKEKGIEQVVFDRGRFLYHGRVKALADGLREGGLRV